MRLFREVVGRGFNPLARPAEKILHEALIVNELSEIGEKKDLWLVHRLDRVVGGLVIFARTKNAAAELSNIVARNEIDKEYLAVVEGKSSSGVMEDYLFKDAIRGKSFVVNGARRGAKLARLEYTTLQNITDEKGERSLVKIKLETGRFHQIRAQFSSRKMSIVGDGKYGSHDNRAKMPSLFAYHLFFKYKSERIDVKALPDITEYPWRDFPMEDLV